MGGVRWWWWGVVVVVAHKILETAQRPAQLLQIHWVLVLGRGSGVGEG